MNRPDKNSLWIQGLFNNKRIKVSALVLAVITWYAIHQAINLEITMESIPVTILLEEGWVIQEQSSDTASIRFRGSQEDFRYLQPDTIKVIIDSRDADKGGETQMRLLPKHVQAPGGARPLTIRPSEIQFRIDRESEKAAPVKVDVLGEPPAGYAVIQVTAQPATVNVTGPFERLDDVSQVRTVPVDVQNRRESFKALVALEASESPWITRLEPMKVNVSVTIAEQATNQEVESVPIRVLTDPSKPIRITLQTASVKVVLKGREELLSRITPESLHAYVDCSALSSPATSSVPVLVRAPDQIVVERIEPETVEVRLESL